MTGREGQGQDFRERHWSEPQPQRAGGRKLEGPMGSKLGRRRSCPERARWVRRHAAGSQEARDGRERTLQRAVGHHGVSGMVHVYYSPLNIFLSCEDQAPELLPLYLLLNPESHRCPWTGHFCEKAELTGPSPSLAVTFLSGKVQTGCLSPLNTPSPPALECNPLPLLSKNIEAPGRIH